MKKLCVIGDPVGHSLSPAIHRRLIAATDAAYTYGICPVKANELTDFVAQARTGAYAGFNVTMPHKKAIIPLLDQLTEEARQCGAVNTVRISDGHAVGHNTDGQGFLNSLHAAGFSPAGKTVLLLGAGGAAEAVASALVRSGVAHLVLCNRSVDKAKRLAAQYPGNVTVIPFTEATLHLWAAKAQLLINATPLGMADHDTFPDLSFLAQSHAVVYDLVYHPRETMLLRQARQLGLPTIGGKALLLHQAVLAFTFFTGIEVTPDDELLSLFT